MTDSRDPLAHVPTSHDLTAPIALDACRLLLRHEDAAEVVQAGEGEIVTGPPPVPRREAIGFARTMPG